MITALTSYHRNTVNGLFSSITNTTEDIWAAYYPYTHTHTHTTVSISALSRRLFPVGLKWDQVILVSQERYFHSYRGRLVWTHTEVWSLTVCVLACVCVCILFDDCTRKEKKSTPSSNPSLISAVPVKGLLSPPSSHLLILQWTVDRPCSSVCSIWCITVMYLLHYSIGDCVSFVYPVLIKTLPSSSSPNLQGQSTRIRPCDANKRPTVL